MRRVCQTLFTLLLDYSVDKRFGTKCRLTMSLCVTKCILNNDALDKIVSHTNCNTTASGNKHKFQNSRLFMFIYVQESESLL